MLLSFSALVLQSSAVICMIESLLCYHFHILVGIFFHYRTQLVYSNDGLPQIALGLREQASWMHTHLVSFRAFIHLQIQCIRCMAIPTPCIDINRWASPQPIDQPRQCETFSLFVFSHNLSHHILFHPQCYIHGSRSCIA